MNVIKVFRFAVFGAALGAALVLVSCPFAMDTSGKAEEEGTGSLEISVSSSGLSSSRNLVPNVLLEVVSYDIAGTGPSGKTFSVVGLTPGSTRNVSDLVPGAWSVAATGFNKYGEEIVSDSAPATVLSGKTTSVPLTCVPFSGNGTLTLNVSWPADSVEDTARTWASLGVPGGPFGTSFEFSPPTQSAGNVSAAWTDSTLKNGFHTLRVQLKDGAAVLWTSNIETVLILDGKITSGSWTLSAGNLAQGGVTMNIGSNAYPPVTVSLSGAVSQLYQEPESEMTVSAESDLAPASWEWYLDGEKIQGAGQNSYTVEGKNLAKGFHTLDVIAYGGNRAGSKGISFYVVPLSDMQYYGDRIAGYACNKASIERSGGIYTMKAGQGLASDGSEDSLNELFMELPATPRRAGKSFLGILAAPNGTPLTANYSVSFERTSTEGTTDSMMYFNLTVDGPGVTNTRGGTGVLVAFPCLKPSENAAIYLLRPNTPINNINGGTIDGIIYADASEVNVGKIYRVGDKTTGARATLQTLIDKGLVLKNALTKDKGAPQTKVLAGTLIIVGDSGGGNMAGAQMVVSKLQYSF